jgi:heptosyltransferase I
MKLPFQQPPSSLCILRLSAVGDICHTLPVVRTIQHAWPQTQLSWIVGKLEASLIRDISDINFIIFDKSKGWYAYRQVSQQLKGQHFDALLHMQMSIRSSIINRLVHTPIRLGFDRERAKDLQWLFNNHQILAHPQQHVMDSFFGFTETLGIKQRQLRWDIPIADQERTYIEELLPPGTILVISPCSSMSYRNWIAERYAAVADYASEQLGLSVVLSGGPSPLERKFGEDIQRHAKTPLTNLIGKTNLKQLLALLDCAWALISPDSGPAHMATAVNTPVIGLYACTNPDRARPYFSADTTIDRYHEAVIDKHGKPPKQLPWGLRIRDSGTMARITVMDVIKKLNWLNQSDNTKPTMN